MLITELDKAIEVVSPEQIVCPEAGFIVATGIGLTAIETIVVIPEQPFTLGVIA